MFEQSCTRSQISGSEEAGKLIEPFEKGGAHEDVMDCQGSG